MSRLEELIDELCPNGVEHKTINQIASISIGEFVHKNRQRDDSLYPVYNGGISNTGYYDEFNRTANKIIISARGANAGYVNRIYTNFWSGNSCYTIEVIDKLVDWNYVYYWLKSKELKLLGEQQKAGIPAVSKKQVESFTVVIPPLEIQHEIVRILDNFTELTAKLTAELTAELTTRKKQYEYYRTQLLASNVSKVKLRTVIKNRCSGATPTKGKGEYYENGTIPWMRTQDVKFNEIREVSSFITEEAVKKTAVKWIPANCVIVAISGATAGRCAINKFETTTNQHCLNLEIDGSKALYKYVFYCVSNQYEELLSKKQGARGDLNSTLVLDMEIPLPSIEKQKKIIDILERFDSLYNDISEGLPVEIEARQKQYEYYRDKLLTFKKLGAHNV